MQTQWNSCSRIHDIPPEDFPSGHIKTNSSVLSATPLTTGALTTPCPHLCRFERKITRNGLLNREKMSTKIFKVVFLVYCFWNTADNILQLHDIFSAMARWEKPFLPVSTANTCFSCISSGTFLKYLKNDLHCAAMCQNMNQILKPLNLRTNICNYLIRLEISFHIL